MSPPHISIFHGRIGRAADLMRDAKAALRGISIGTPEIDAALPWAGLPRGLHEIAAAAGDAANVGFAAMLMHPRSGGVLWCRSRRAALDAGDPYGPGLAAFGLTRDRLIIVEAGRPADLLWAMEEGARTRGMACVVGEGASPDLTASRRLQLAAEAGNCVVMLLRSASSQERAVSDLPASSALTRWFVRSVPSSPQAGGPGKPCWSVALWRCRGGGRPQSWILEWDDAALSMSVVSPLADRPLAAMAG